jgi:DNA polymerase-1
MIYYIGNQLNVNFTKTVEYCDINKLFLWLENNNKIGCDTETEGFFNHDNKVLLLQFGNNENQFVVNTKDVNINIFKKYLENDLKTFYFWNAKFDLKFLKQYDIDIQKINVFDCFLAECVLTTGYSKEEIDLSLSYNTNKYCGASLNKEVRGMIHKGITERVIVYSSEDVKYLIEISKSQNEKLIKENLIEIIRLENKFVKCLAEIEYYGMPFNKNTWSIVEKQVNEELKNIQNSLDDLLLKKSQVNKNLFKFVDRQQSLGLFETRKSIVNWSSAKQKLNVLNTIGEEKGFKIDDTNDRTLQKIKRKDELISVLVNYNKFNKLESSFGKNFYNYINKKTNRIHCDYWQIVSTGRISCSEPNLLNIPSKGDLSKVIRQSFEAPVGYKIVGGDYSGMELAILAQLSNDENWIDILSRKDGDLHGELATKTFNIPLSEVRNKSIINPSVSFRDIQKTVNFGLAYGMSFIKLADTLDISENDAKNIIEMFFKSAPKVEKFLYKMGKFGEENGYILTPPPFNRKRYFPEWELTRNSISEKNTVNGKSVYSILGEINRASKNMPIQGANGDIIKLAIINLFKLINTKYKNKNIKIINSIYDEILSECPDELVDQWLLDMKNVMIEAASIIITNFKVKVDIKSTQYWQK